jgi:hypothetical protein
MHHTEKGFSRSKSPKRYEGIVSEGTSAANAPSFDIDSASIHMTIRGKDSPPQGVKMRVGARMTKAGGDALDVGDIAFVKPEIGQSGGGILLFDQQFKGKSCKD